MDMVELLAATQGMLPNEAAATYAANGVPVFPCVPGAKEPRIPRGFLEATTDSRTVDTWWKKWPTANIGVPTGRAGFDIVDVDCHPSGTGFAALERARRAGLTEGWAAIVRTPSGGLHYYYPADPDREQRSWSEGTAHVDLRGTGGYVIVPPSSIAEADDNTGRYELIAKGRNPSPVDSLALRVFLNPERGREPSPARPRGSPDAFKRGIADWLRTRPMGTRNASLFWAASRYAENGVGQGEALEVLGSAAQQTDLKWTEIAQTIRSAYRRTGALGGGGQEARQLPGGAETAKADPLAGSTSTEQVAGPLPDVKWERIAEVLERQAEGLAGRGISKVTQNHRGDREDDSTLRRGVKAPGGTRASVVAADGLPPLDRFGNRASIGGKGLSL